MGQWNEKEDVLEMLLQQPNIHPEHLKAHLVEVINSLNNTWVDMYVKYHPELNFIEMFWGYVKRNVRARCSYD